MATPATELKTDELRVPDRAKLQLPEDLATVIMDKFGNKSVEVHRAGGYTTNAVLRSVASNNGQLSLAFDDRIIPWAAVSAIRKH